MTGNSRIESNVEEGTSSFWRRMVRFIGKPPRYQYRSLATRLQSKLPSLPIPIYLPFGVWYLVDHSEVDYRILFDCFEVAETQFIQRYLQPGMTVLDIGAHHGYYSLIASRAVREQGAVHAFEPAPRERAHLKSNLALNRCKQVSVYEFALGATRGTATLFEAETKLDGCNSLRPQDGVSRSKRFEVEVFPLDQFVLDHQLEKVDFIKMDVEGAELSVLQGASELLGASYRPVILAEVSDLRTKGWGYRALEILRHLEGKGFGWFEITPGGRLAKANIDANFFDRNMVAASTERMDGLRMLLDEQ
jgi:FkbM family methyltransferase